MAVPAALPALRRTLSLSRGLTARVSLTLIVASSFALRVVASAAHPAPAYFPDEYLYTAIARSLGAGHAPTVRGAPAHFPALLEPILAAPLQWLAAPEVAYRLTQMENALAMSLAAVPVYLLARRLSLSARYALACAAFAIAIPDLVYASWTLADPIAYPFALGAVAAGVAALDRPSRRLQLAFLVLAFFATLARVQYVILPFAFVVASFAVDRRHAFRTQRLPLVLVCAPLLGALALGPARALGYYSHVTHLHVSTALVHWAATDLYLLALVSGVVLVPGALAALVRPRGRRELAFAALASTFAVGLLFEAALYASNAEPGTARFQERYLFSLLPLLPIAFGLYLKHGRPLRLPVAVLSVALFLLSARIPLSGYAAGVGDSDSPFLFAVVRLERIVGTANASLVVALLAAAGAFGAVAVSRRGGGRLAVGAALAFVACASLGAVVNDAANARQVRAEYLPANVSWVDASGLRDVTLVQTVGSPPNRATEQLYWNRSVTHEVRLGDALPTDVYPAPRVRAAPDGTLNGVPGNMLFEAFAATAEFQNATLLARAGSFTLWSSETTPRLGLLEQGRYYDGWLARAGRLTVWPDATGRSQGTLRFTLSLPLGAKPVTVRFGRARYDVEPGRRTTIVYTIDRLGPWSLAFAAGGGTYLQDLRAVSVQSTPPVLRRSNAPTPRPTISV
ncbi:MAG TPA: hypothetical protein VNC40_01360 [Gaiellaceae bacterium]|nr:hypothetical protein [Gaiellaceae bacterium]